MVGKGDRNICVPQKWHNHEQKTPWHLSVKCRIKCKVGYLRQSATCHSWPRSYRHEKFLWYYTWSLTNNLVTVPHLVLCFLFKLKLHMLADLKFYKFCIMLYTGRNIHSLTELPVVHPTFIPSPHYVQWAGILCKQLVTIQWQIYVPAFLIYHLSTHYELCICTSDCAQLNFQCQVVSISWPATSITWADMNGTKGDQ